MLCGSPAGALTALPSAFLLLLEASQPHAGQVTGLEVAPAEHWQSPQGPSPLLETQEQ